MILDSGSMSFSRYLATNCTYISSLRDSRVQKKKFSIIAWAGLFFIVPVEPIT